VKTWGIFLCIDILITARNSSNIYNNPSVFCFITEIHKDYAEIHGGVMFK